MDTSSLARLSPLFTRVGLLATLLALLIAAAGCANAQDVSESTEADEAQEGGTEEPAQADAAQSDTNEAQTTDDTVSAASGAEQVPDYEVYGDREWFQEAGADAVLTGVRTEATDEESVAAIMRDVSASEEFAEADALRVFFYTPGELGESSAIGVAMYATNDAGAAFVGIPPDTVAFNPAPEDF